MSYTLIPLTRGKNAKIDSADYQRGSAFPWHFNGRGYAVRKAWVPGGRGLRVNVFLHRFLLDAPQHLGVDHVNGDTLDNRRSNLRLATQSQNLANRRVRRNASGFRGVYRHGSRWQAQIKQNGKQKHLGMFAKKLDAAKAYNRAARTAFGSFATLNDIPR